ncbi:MAG TPA: hypothetical protein VGA78_05645, partial [Gemmatimonadales bacterium]
MDPYRLPSSIIPSRYDIRLSPDLDATAFEGQETIALDVREPIEEVVLNAAELEIVTAELEDADGERWPCAARLDETTERLHLSPPRPLTPGTWHLSLSFRGTLNDRLRGFYRVNYQEPDGQSAVLAATQFESTDARRAFPCWDEPSFKAVFSLTLTIDPQLTAVANTSILSEAVENGLKVIRFADTIRMSTYLVAIVVGRLAIPPA